MRKNKIRPFADRFWERVTKSDGCWSWDRPAHRFGYGAIYWRDNGGQNSSHVASWKLHFGPIPDGQFVCHKCDNPICVRPDHLFLGTAGDNVRDMNAKGRAVKYDRSGEKNPNYGKSHTQEARERIRQARSKRYLLRDRDGNVIEIFNMAKFCREHQMSWGSICLLRQGKIKKTIDGYTWVHTSAQIN